MKRRDVFVLNWIFASLYFPTSMILWWLNQKGTFFGVLIVGLVFHIVLTVLLVLMPFVERQKTTTEMITPKRAYKKKNKPEVKNNEEKSEVEPTVRTDVDLNQLDADNDDIPD